LIILDWNLPRYNGDEILNELNNSPKCSAVPVILFTSSDSPNDRQLAARHGVAEYFRKPTHFEEFMELGRIVKQILNGCQTAN
jgi:DNA-binding response OmpR family regulator